MSTLTRSLQRPVIQRRGSAMPATTPALLAIWAAGIVLSIAAFGAVAAIAVAARGSAADSARASTEPLLVDAQSVYTSLSDADSTAAGAFLAGSSAPQALRVRYESDLAAAAGSLVQAAQQAGADSQLARSIRTLSVDLPIYSGLVETARANNLQGFPVGAAYLDEASNLMRTALLPAASGLYQTELRRLRDDQSGATAVVGVAIAAALGILVLAAGVALQLWLRRRFSRLVSPPLLVAMAITVGLLAWLVLALSAQTRDVHRSEQQGTSPLATLTEARILALRARSDDELTLVTRDSVPSYQADYALVSQRLPRQLTALSAAQSDGAVANEAASDFARVQTVHETIRRDDVNGDLGAAIVAAAGPGAGALPATASSLDGVLLSGISDAQRRFDAASSAASSVVSGVVVGVIALSFLMAGLVLLAVRPRLAEYR